MAMSGMRDSFVHYALNHPKKVIGTSVVLTLVLILLAAVPNFVDVPALSPIAVDTDPENMLSEDEPVRIFHEEQRLATKAGCRCTTRASKDTCMWRAFC